MRALNKLKGLEGDNEDQTTGVAIARRAIQEPLRQIVANAGAEPSVVLNKVMGGKGNFGFNAQTEEYGDMVKMGILDPTKVVRAAIQNAASIAGVADHDRGDGGGKAEEERGSGDASGRNGRHGRNDVRHGCRAPVSHQPVRNRAEEPRKPRSVRGFRISGGDYHRRNQRESAGRTWSDPTQR